MPNLLPIAPERLERPALRVAQKRAFLAALASNEPERVERLLLQEPRLLCSLLPAFHEVSAFFVTARDGLDQSLHTLLKWYVDLNHPSVGDALNDALRIAAGRGHVKCLSLLLPLADPMWTWRGDGLTALHHVCENDPSPERREAGLADGTRWGSESDRLQCLELLLPHCNPLAHSTEHGFTPLMNAAYYNNAQAVKVLIPFSDLEARNAYGLTALALAVNNATPCMQTEHTVSPCVRLLSEKSNLFTITPDGRTLFDHLSQSCATRSFLLDRVLQQPPRDLQPFVSFLQQTERFPELVACLEQHLLRVETHQASHLDALPSASSPTRRLPRL